MTDEPQVCDYGKLHALWEKWGEEQALLRELGHGAQADVYARCCADLYTLIDRERMLLKLVCETYVAPQP